jgi:mono/diheme cytochrome c family protein
MAGGVNNSAGREPVKGDFLLPRPPYWMVAGGTIFLVASWIPLVMIARARTTPKKQPRIHIVQDMDNQPKYKPQSASPVFADGRAMRPAVTGTVAQGHLSEDDHYYRGFSSKRSKDGETWEVKYFDGFPERIEVDEALIRRGKERFNIYCTPCHGYDGAGNGIVNQRALELEEPRWVPPTSLHTDTVRNRPNGHLFNTITNGIRNMPGYGGQIPVGDRWAVVAYIRALQLSQNARIEDVPPEIRPTLR